MFTGIVEAVGTVESLLDGVMTVRHPEGFASDPIVLGESIAVNGCCLTVVTCSNGALTFDLSPETLARTSLGTAHRVNLERAMQVGARFGGHIVQGHVDATATLLSREDRGNAVIFRFKVDPDQSRYLIDKGSITLDGISLTVVSPSEDGSFETWIIPHTLSETNLSDRRAGEVLNVEFDVLAKYVERLLASRS